MSDAEDTAKDGKSKKQPKVAAKKDVSQMKPGDYTFHLLIQKSKDLDFGEDAEADAANIVCEVSVQDKKESTKVIENVTATTVVNFDSHIFVELFQQSVADLEATKILIKVNQKGYFKNSLIGQIEMDLTYLYNLENHTSQHKWFGMINPDSEDFSSVAGYIKISASVHGVDDSPVELKIDDKDDDADAVMPASIKPKFTQLKMHIVKGECLPRLDVKMIGKGSMDALVSTKVNGKLLKTKCITTENDEASWYQTLLVPVRMPIMSGKLILSVMDRDTVTDETAGSLQFDFKELLQMEQRSFFWANIYGAPGQEEVKVFESGSMEKLVDEMNTDPSKASCWKGRVLIGVEHEESETPKLGVEPMSVLPPIDPMTELPIEGAKSICDEAKALISKVKFKMMYEFNSVINTPEPEGKYNLMLKIGEHEWISEGGDARAVGYNYNRWNQRSKIVEFDVPYRKVEDLEDIFLYLCPDKGGLGGLLGGGKSKPGKPISYVKLRASDYMEPNPGLQWLEMIVEPVEDAIDSPELAGIVGLRLTILRDENPVDIIKEANWAKKMKRRPDSAKIRCYLFQCKGLPAADDDGSSDPKVRVFNTIDLDGNSDRMKKQIVETDVIDDNCDPMYYQLLELKIDYMKGEDLPPFVFDIYDVDKALIGSDSTDYLGRCIVKLNDTAHKHIDENSDSVDMKPETPKWHSIRFKQGAPECGQILCSFVIPKEFDHDWKLPNEHVRMMGMNDDSAVVRFDEYRVELNVLGLRGLLSPGLLPVKKAYIEFMLKSLVPPIAASALTTISTSPGPTGENPTINQVISFNVPMPVDPLYAPSMACRVLDKVFKGFSGMLIGSFSIPIGQIMIDQKAEYEKNCNELDDVIRQLDDVLSGKAVLDYAPTQPAGVDEKTLENKQFRDKQRADKKVYTELVDKEESKSMIQKAKETVVAPPKQTAQGKVAQKLANQKKSGMKRRLLIATDEDSDEDGATTVNPVAMQDTEHLKYMPPTLNLALNEDDGRTSVATSRLDDLARTPRSQLSASEKREVDQDAIMAAVQEAHDPDMLKKVTPKAGQPFRPPAAPKITANDVERQIKARSGNATPVSSQGSIKQFTPSKSGIQRELLEIHSAHSDAIDREVKSQRQQATKDMEAKAGVKEIKMLMKPSYFKDERLNASREINKPDPLLFEELGWDRDPDAPGEKHYRKFVTKELETVKAVMSRPSEFNVFPLMKGQARGASSDTSTEMGKFKALITVAHRDTEVEKDAFIMRKLSVIHGKLAQIYKKQTKKDYPIQPGFFCEPIDGNPEASVAGARVRAYSGDIKDPEPESELNFSTKMDGLASTRSNKSFCFHAGASTILNAEGRAQFKELTRAMKLTHLQILRKVVDVQSDEIIKRLLMQETKCDVRVYIVRAMNLAARDSDSPSDPFVKVILGEKIYTERDNYKEDDMEPDIYKMFQFQSTFPGCPLLKIEFWDYDLLFGDDLIGATTIDLEDRYFSSDFKAFQHKPIEHRQLHHYSTEMSQGTVVMWAEINEMTASTDAAPLYDISKKPTEDFECRVVIWDTVELEMMDAEGTTDGFVRCFFNSDHSLDTDTHFRNSDGKCSWNYRLLFPITYGDKNKRYEITTQAYDLDLFKSNDLIGQVVLDLEPMIEDSMLAKRPMSLTKEYYDGYLAKDKGMKGLTFESEDSRQFWVELKGKKDGKSIVMGKLKMSLDVFPKREAELNQVGKGQSEPNVNPFLPKPTGRIEFSFNPIKMLMQLVGPALRRKLYCYCCIVLCCALCVMMAPMIFSNIISNALTPG